MIALGIQTNTNKQVDPMVFVPLPVDLDDSNDDEGVLEVGGFLGSDLWALGLGVWLPGYPATVAVRGTGSTLPCKGSCISRGGKVWWGKRDMFHVFGMERRSLSGSFFLRSGMESVI